MTPLCVLRRVERYGGPDGARTRDLLRDRQASWPTRLRDRCVIVIVWRIHHALLSMGGHRCRGLRGRRPDGLLNDTPGDPEVAGLGTRMHPHRQRRERDSNSRACYRLTLSKRAPSTTRPSLQVLLRVAHRGGGRIRTADGSPHARFQNGSLQPLSHSSMFSRCSFAEGVGVEPTTPLGAPAFQTGAFGHSAIPPVRGSGEIRTHDTLRCSGFRNRRLQPLGHASIVLRRGEWIRTTDPLSPRQVR
jgi:hypothetical protein